ncbi:unnamed protein product [Moneuplotes crassus]|uniref:Uncharacterized protein n=1 Tax=Euplotes crassus TaxID=5936 RepID=A0AAD1XSB7_EUPCR|nr:unnamed protein product [Moneuplotes crassus]
MSDWEDFADEDADIEQTQDTKKFEDEELVDKDKEEREEKERLEEKKIIQAEIEHNRKEKKKDEVDYDKKFAERHKIDEETKDLTREEVKKQNPNFTEIQIDEFMSRQAEEKIGDDLFGGDNEPETPKTGGFVTSLTEIKGEKKYKDFARDVADYLKTNGKSPGQIPKFFSQLFHELGTEITTGKMAFIVKEFNNAIDKKKEDEDKKRDDDKKKEKKSKGKKKAGLAGVSKAQDTVVMNTAMANDMFENEDYGEGEDYDYGGDQYQDYGRDDLDFM